MIDLKDTSTINGYDAGINIQQNLKAKGYKTNMKSSIQVSYPTTIDTVEYTNGTFYLSNALPNFTYTNSTKSIYITGSAVQGFVTNIPVQVSTSKTYSNSLVIKHTGPTIFYVVIPLEYKKDSKTSLSALLKNEKPKLNLNSDISNPDANTSIYRCKASTISTDNNVDVFVFDKPIMVNTQISNSNSLSITGVTPFEVVTSNSKIEEGVDCQTGEEEEESTNLSQPTSIINFIHLIMFFVDIPIIIGSYMLFKKDTFTTGEKMLGTLLAIFSVICFIVFLAYLFGKKDVPNKEVVTIISGNIFVASIIGPTLAVLLPKDMFTSSIASLPSSIASLPSSVASVASASHSQKGIKHGWLGFPMT